MNEVVGGMLSLVIFLGCAWGWAWVVARWRVGRPALAPHGPPRGAWGLADLLVLAAAVLAGLTLVVGMGSELLAEDPYQNGELNPQVAGPFFLLDAFGKLLGVGVGLAWLAMRYSGAHLRRTLPLAEAPDAGDWRLGLVAFAMLAVPTFTLQFLLVQWSDTTERHQLIELLEANPQVGFLAVAVFSAVIVAPLTEEILFRGLLQPWLERLGCERNWQTLLLGGFAESGEIVIDAEMAAEIGPDDAAGAEEAPPLPIPSASGGVNPYEPPLSVWPPGEALPAGAGGGFRPQWWPIIATSAIFAALHLGQGPAPVPLFFLSLGLGYLAQRTRRLWPCVLVHMLLNGTSLALLWLATGAE